MFTLPAALMIDEFADTSAVELKAAIDAALSQLPARRNHEICLCVAGGKFHEAAATLDEYNGAEKVLKKIASIIDETIKHGGTGKPVPVVATADYELPEMPTRPSTSVPSGRHIAEYPVAVSADPQPQVATNGAGERRTRKRA